MVIQNYPFQPPGTINGVEAASFKIEISGFHQGFFIDVDISRRLEIIYYIKGVHYPLDLQNGP